MKQPSTRMQWRAVDLTLTGWLMPWVTDSMLIVCTGVLSWHLTSSLLHVNTLGSFCVFLVRSLWISFCVFLVRSLWISFCVFLVCSLWISFCVFLVRSLWISFCVFVFLVRSLWISFCVFLVWISFCVFLVCSLWISFCVFLVRSLWISFFAIASNNANIIGWIFSQLFRIAEYCMAVCLTQFWSRAIFAHKIFTR